MTHSTTYPFRRWYRRPLTPRESAVIGLLERRRRRTGRVSIVLTVSAAEHAAISRLLLHYALFLNNRCTLSYTLLVTAAGAIGPTPHSTLPTPDATAFSAPNSSLLTARSATNSPLRAPPAAPLSPINSQLYTTPAVSSKPASIPVSADSSPSVRRLPSCCSGRTAGAPRDTGCRSA